MVLNKPFFVQENISDCRYNGVVKVDFYTLLYSRDVTMENTELIFNAVNFAKHKNKSNRISEQS